MKKRKTYEISVIDKTYSKTISDETKFYTSDTALELGFELKETEYDFESAEIVLLNIDDRSLVTRPVAKNLDGFSYELDDDITAHYGEWHGQLRFEQAGEIYVSSPVKFRIENDLNNDRPPQLSDVQSWVSLKRYADGLVEELKQVVLSVEGIEDTFNVNELERQDKFETAEQSRQATFEANETGRDETFNVNETTRQAQELEREKAETNRQTIFDNNEAGRFETFNTNETTRQVNENARQQAETQRQLTFETNESERQSTFEVNETERQTTFETGEQERQSAEIIRVENENQRILTYDNLQDTIDMIGKVKLVNLVVNGDFRNGLNKWMTYNNLEVNVTSEGAEMLATLNGSRLYQRIDVPIGDILYSAVLFKSDTPTNFTHSTNQTIHSFDYNNQEFQFLSVLTDRINLSVLSIQAVNIDTSPKRGILKYMIGINLTETFGAGNEPTKEVMDWIIKENGYFEELTLRRDDIQQYEINQLRKAVIALGGTI